MPEITLQPPKPGNKFAYKLTVESVEKSKPVIKFFVSTTKIELGAAFVDFKGVEVSSGKFNSTLTYDDAEKLLKDSEIGNYIIPNNRIVCIENILYKQRNAKQEKNNDN